MKKIINKLIGTKTILFILGVFSGFAFAPTHYFFLSLIGFATLMHFLKKAEKFTQSMGYGFAFGAGTGFSSLSWICNALLIEGAQINYLIPIVLMGLCLFLGIFYMIPSMLAHFFKNQTAKWLAFSALFVIFEWIRSWLFTGFPWNLLGYIWTNNIPLLQTVSVVGIYGLSLFTVLFFTSFALLPQKTPLITLTIICATCYGFGCLHLFETPRENVFGVNLRLVQPNIKQSLKWDPEKAEENFNTLLKLSYTNNKNITHIIWPESALPFLPEINTLNRMRLTEGIRQGSHLLTGGLRIANRESKNLANSLFIFDDLANIIGTYDKFHLVPFGEYVPFREKLPITKIVPIPADFLPGTGPKTMYVPKAPPVSPLICYEVIFPGKIINKKARPEWILNLTNDAWYGLSAGPHQHLAIAKTRAVEEGLPLVRATNNGISAVINPYGEIVASLELGKQGIVDSGLPRKEKPTLYSQFGNKIPLSLCLIILGIAIALSFKNKITHRKTKKTS